MNRAASTVSAAALTTTVATVLLLMSCVVVQAQEKAVWPKKPWQEWTKKDVEQVLNESPWVQARKILVPVGRANAPNDFTFILRLRSALPMRQALVRQRQLEAKYDKMNERERAAFDAKTQGLLDCPACADNYVLTLTSRSENNPGFDWVYVSFSSVTLPWMKQYAYIANEQGEERRLVNFVQPKQQGVEAIFFFPRLDASGAPLIKPESKKLIFRLSPHNTSQFSNFEFDVSKLMVDGNVLF
jgi:hypothetical protein